jgi:hypothetical protein
MSETNQKWKYITSQHFHAEDDHKLCEKFDYYGYLGWELVCVVPYPHEGLSIAHWKQTHRIGKIMEIAHRIPVVVIGS